MLFGELCKIFDMIEDEIDLRGGVKGIFHFGVVVADVTGGQLVVFVDNVTEAFEWNSAAETVDVFI